MARFVPRMLREQPGTDGERPSGADAEREDATEATDHRPRPRVRRPAPRRPADEESITSGAENGSTPDDQGSSADDDELGGSGSGAASNRGAAGPGADEAASPAVAKGADEIASAGNGSVSSGGTGADEPASGSGTGPDEAPGPGETGPDPADGSARDGAGPGDGAAGDGDESDPRFGQAEATSDGTPEGESRVRQRPGRRPVPGAPRPHQSPAPAGRPPRQRRVVAAPRTGSNRRASVAEATLARLRRTAVILTVCVVVSGLLAVTAWYLEYRGNAVERASTEATSAARAAAVAIFSYDYRSFDRSVADGKDHVTGDFAKEYAETTGGLAATAKKEKAIVSARVSGASVADASADRVEVLLFVNQYRRNVNITGEKVDENRVVLTMVHREDGSGQEKWYVAGAAAM